MPKVVSVEPFHPGEYIQEELDARGWSHAALADMMGQERLLVVKLCQRRTGITPSIARALATALGVNAQTWLNLQAAYEAALAAQQARQSIKERVTAEDAEEGRGQATEEVGQDERD